MNIEGELAAIGRILERLEREVGRLRREVQVLAAEIGPPPVYAAPQSVVFEAA